MLHTYLNNMVFYNMILRLVIQGYISYSLSSFLNSTDVRLLILKAFSLCGRTLQTISPLSSR